MKYNAIHNAKTHCLSAIDTLFVCAESLGMTVEELTQGYIDILANYPKLPRYMREYLRGVFDTRYRDTMRDKIIHGGFHNGVFYSTKSNRPDYYGNVMLPSEWCELTHNGTIQTGLFWKANLKRF